MYLFPCYLHGWNGIGIDINDQRMGMQHVHVLSNRSACIGYISGGIDTGFCPTPPDPMNSSVI